MNPLRIILVDDNDKFRESIKDMLVNIYNYQVVGEASNGEEFLKLPITLNPHVVLMDLTMPQLDGYLATKKYVWEYPGSKVVAVTNQVEKIYLKRLVEVGFKGCIFKYNFFEEIAPAIATVMSGKLWFPVDVIDIDSS